MDGSHLCAKALATVVVALGLLSCAEITSADGITRTGPEPDAAAVTGAADAPTTSLWLPPAVNVDPRRKKPKADWDLLTRQLYCYSYPSSPPLQSVLNPWGEQAPIHRGPLTDLPRRILAACEIYRYQSVHFDGYLGSEDDGRHLYLAADGKNLAVFGDNEAKTYRTVPQGLTDTLDERCWICVDLPIFATTLAGFPMRQAMTAHFLETPDLYTDDGLFPANVPVDQWYFRRVENLRKYCRAKQFYSEDKITIAQFLDPAYRPPAPFQPGDIVLMGHYQDFDNKGPFEMAKHSGIVESVDARGMPVRLFNMRTTGSLLDRYDAVIDQTRVNRGHEVYFKHFYDRYPIICHARIVNRFDPKGGMPTPEKVREFLEKRGLARAAGAVAAPATKAAVQTTSGTAATTATRTQPAR